MRRLSSASGTSLRSRFPGLQENEEQAPCTIILEEYNGKRRGSARLSARKLYARTELELELDNEEEAEESDDSGQDSMFQELEDRSAIAL